jgi:hypothetical protein
LIAQSRWPRWAIWRSSGYDFGTELDAPAGPKRLPKVYIVSILKPVLRRHCNVCKGFLVTSLTDCHKLGFCAHRAGEPRERWALVREVSETPGTLTPGPGVPFRPEPRPGSSPVKSARREPGAC